MVIGKLVSTLFELIIHLYIFSFRDSLVPVKWGQSSFEEMQKVGVKGEFVALKNTMHEIKKCEFVQLSKWIEKILPPLESDLSNKL
jgi:hypothetical protein